MKILIAGAGAVGTLIGGKLASSGQDVIVYQRSQHQCEAIRKQGLVYVEDGRQHQVQVKAYSDLSSLFAQEVEVFLAVFAVKSFSIRSVVLSLAPYLHRIHYILTIGNGLANEEMLFDYVNPAKIVAAALTIACSTREPGHARAENKGGIALAPVGARRVPKEIVSTLREGGFAVKTYASWRSVKWSKVLVNILGNATCAILDLPMHEVYQDPVLFGIERQLFLEAGAVMKACGIKAVSLPGQPVPLYQFAIRFFPEQLLRKAFEKKLKQGRGNKLASLHLDFLQGKRETEWPFLYGVLLEKARGKGVHTPVLETLCLLLEGITSGKISWEKFRKNPKALAAAVSETRRRGAA